MTPNKYFDLVDASASGSKSLSRSKDFCLTNFCLFSQISNRLFASSLSFLASRALASWWERSLSSLKILSLLKFLPNKRGLSFISFGKIIGLKTSKGFLIIGLRLVCTVDKWHSSSSSLKIERSFEPETLSFSSTGTPIFERVLWKQKSIKYKILFYLRIQKYLTAGSGGFGCKFWCGGTKGGHSLFSVETLLDKTWFCNFAVEDMTFTPSTVYFKNLL